MPTSEAPSASATKRSGGCKETLVNVGESLVEDVADIMTNKASLKRNVIVGLAVGILVSVLPGAFIIPGVLSVSAAALKTQNKRDDASTADAD